MEKTLSSLSAFVAAIDIRLFSAMQELRRDVEFLQMLTWGILPLLMLSTIVFGFLLQARVMQPLQHLKKQSRKLADSILTLQKELRVFEAEKKASTQVATAPLDTTATGVDDPETKQV
jgi:nitrate/nitrite-specific signal transduction histidine kinase